MADYPGSNSSGNLKGLNKEVYSNKIEKLIPGTGKTPIKFKRIKNALKIKD